MPTIQEELLNKVIPPKDTKKELRKEKKRLIEESIREWQKPFIRRNHILRKNGGSK